MRGRFRAGHVFQRRKVQILDRFEAQRDSEVFRPLCSATNLIVLNFRQPSCRYLLESVFVMQTAEDGASYHPVTIPNMVT